MLPSFLFQAAWNIRQYIHIPEWWMWIVPLEPVASTPNFWDEPFFWATSFAPKALDRFSTFSKIPDMVSFFFFFSCQKNPKKIKGKNQRGIYVAVPNYIQSKEPSEVVAKLDSTPVAGFSLGALMGRFFAPTVASFSLQTTLPASHTHTTTQLPHWEQAKIYLRRLLERPSKGAGESSTIRSTRAPSTTEFTGKIYWSGSTDFEIWETHKNA